MLHRFVVCYLCSPCLPEVEVDKVIHTWVSPVTSWSSVVDEFLSFYDSLFEVSQFYDVNIVSISVCGPDIFEVLEV